MLLTNQWLDKIATSHVDFNSQGMLNQTCLSSAIGVFGEPYCLIIFRESLTLVYLLAQILLGDNSNGSDATSDNAEATHNSTDHTQQGASMQDNGDMPVADDSPMDLSVHVQLTHTPRKLLSHMFFVHSRIAVQSNSAHTPYPHFE